MNAQRYENYFNNVLVLMKMLETISINRLCTYISNILIPTIFVYTVKTELTF